MGFAARGAARGGDGGGSELGGRTRRPMVSSSPEHAMTDVNGGGFPLTITVGGLHRVLHRRRPEQFSMSTFRPRRASSMAPLAKAPLHVRRPIHRHMEHGFWPYVTFYPLRTRAE
jgi:hypothetical protein